MPDDHFSERPIRTPVPVPFTDIAKTPTDWSRFVMGVGACMVSLIFGCWLFAPNPPKTFTPREELPNFKEFMKAAGGDAPAPQPPKDDVPAEVRRKISLDVRASVIRDDIRIGDSRQQVQMIVDRAMGQRDGTPDKIDMFLSGEQLKEFRPLFASKHTDVIRYLPFESKFGARYRVNVLFLDHKVADLYIRQPD